MKLRALLVASMSALLGISLAIVAVNATSAQRLQWGDLIDDTTPVGRGTARPEIGRYQGAVGESHLWLFDTATGKVWMARAKEKWSPAVGPVPLDAK